jgi:tRNA pseudouridine38-40 synthase
VSTWEQTAAKAEFIYEIEANAFLFHMVRRIVRLQVTIAQGKLPVESILMYLSDEHSDPVKGLAPPHGLNLVGVRYPDPEV